MKVFPNCKINIGLNIVERRSDGYHNLQTVFYPIPLHDEISIQLSETDVLSIEGLCIEGAPEDNLVMKVLAILREQGFSIPPVNVTLHKKIPSGAGLGGGSSDAAFMMKALNEMFSLELTDEEMEALLAPLGADCPFFVKNQPVYAEGIGNIFTPICLDLKGWYLILVKPDDFVSTREAYSMVRPHYPEFKIQQYISLPVEEWKGHIVNDFEESVFPVHPRIQSIRDELYRQGATYAAMSGSGSSVYGLFRQLPPAEYRKIFYDDFYYQCQL
jgi:4-diphosphocytidyl-2-C-methyl-D-erythritol kinase